MRIQSRLLCILLLLIFPLCGCACENTADASAPAAPAPHTEAVERTTEPETAGEIARTGAYLCDGEEMSEEGVHHEASLPDENAVLCIDGGVLTISKGDIIKSGDAADPASAKKTGVNAAICAAGSGSVTLEECVVTSEGSYAAGVHAVGVHAVGEGSTVRVTGGQVATSGDGSPALAAVEGGSIETNGAEITTNGVEAEAIYADGAGSVSIVGGKVRANSSAMASIADGGKAVLTDCEITAASGICYASGEDISRSGSAELSGATLALADGKVLTMDGGIFFLTLSKQTLIGNLSAGSGEIVLAIRNGSAFTGQIEADDLRNVTVTLDADSTWTLAGETSVGVLRNADTTFQNIIGNGNTLYYDSSLEGNASLGGKSYALRDGGYLVPMI